MGSEEGAGGEQVSERSESVALPARYMLSRDVQAIENAVDLPQLSLSTAEDFLQIEHFVCRSLEGVPICIVPLSRVMAAAAACAANNAGAICVEATDHAVVAAEISFFSID